MKRLVVISSIGFLFVSSLVVMGQVIGVGSNPAPPVIPPPSNDLRLNETNQTMAIGGNALASNTTAMNNIAFGWSSLSSQTTGGSNIGIGYNTLVTASTGSTGNVAIGDSAMAFYTGSNNVAIGNQAMFSGGNGANQNTAVGAFTMSVVTTGFYNTGIGTGALVALTTGVDNVAIGEGAGSTITTGSYNTIIGARVGNSFPPGTSNVIAIGSNLGVLQADWGYTNANSWTFASPVMINGSLSATLASAAGTSEVCNTAGTTTQLTLVPSGTACASSAARFKNLGSEITLNVNGLDKLRTDTAWSYREDSGLYENGKEHVGLIAEDVEQLDSRCVTYDKEGKLQNYYDRCIISYLVEANKQLKARIEALEHR